MTTVFTVVGVKKLIYQTLEEDYGVLPNGGGSLGGGAGGGLNQTQVEAIVNAAVANLTASGGLTQADVDAAIATAIAAIVPCPLDANAVNALIQVALAGLNIDSAEPLAQSILDAFCGAVGDLITYIAAMDNSLSGVGLSAVAAQTAIELFLTAVAGNPPESAITVAGGGMAGLAVKEWEALVAQVAALSPGGNPAGHFPVRRRSLARFWRRWPRGWSRFPARWTRSPAG